MGYTHYIYRPLTPVTDKQWDGFIADVKKILRKHSGIVCREYDSPDEHPVVDAHMVYFNGKGGEGHETCVVERVVKQPPHRATASEYFSFCKTNRKPYDVAVIAVYRCAQRHLGAKISSDGDGENGKKSAFPSYAELQRIYKLGPQKKPKPKRPLKNYSARAILADYVFSVSATSENEAKKKLQQRLARLKPKNMLKLCIIDELP